MEDTTVEQAATALRPSRQDLADLLIQALTELIPAVGGRAGWQGANDALATWLGQDGPADLDVWADEVGADVLDALLTLLPSARVQQSDDPRRLRHTSYAVETPAGLAVIDVTRGDLMVGPVLLMAARDVQLEPGPDGPRLTGAAAVADLVLRKLLRGGLPPTPRLDQARDQWARLSAWDRSNAAALWQQGLGAAWVAQVELLLVDRTRQPSQRLAKAARRQLLESSLRPRNLRSTWQQRHVVLPAGHRAGPLGLRTRGVVVVLVGTDGSGKSTVAHNLSDRLVRVGFEVVSPYFGMARGNLPGVNLARKMLGVAIEAQSSDTSAEEPSEPSTPPRAQELGNPRIRQLAAWYYAAEYIYKWLANVAPALARHQIVVADRYVYDLRESPWPGSPAARLVEALLPRPDFLVLPDAADDVIHARKPERPAIEQAAQQQRFRQLVSEQPARLGSMIVDSSGDTPDPLADLLARVVQAAHLPPELDRP
ncbi:MAG: thymidylate kinase [Actinomycetes bacterium]